MSELIPADLRYAVQRLPRDIRELLRLNAQQLFIGGGFVRAVIGQEEINDIDLFGPDKAFLERIATTLHLERPGSKLHKTNNAITLITPERLPVQFITRWTFSDPSALVKSFDFTVCQSAIWRTGTHDNSPWASEISNRFYVDLAAKRLTYTNPVREEEAGGSMLRVIKYVKRGYSIQPTSLGDVIGRLTDAVDKDRQHGGLPTGQIIAGLLREVDPLLVVDGFDVVDDHEKIEGET